jgi:hypothetical protein
MRVHVLTGDSLIHPFKQTGIGGDIIISRECLIAGEVSGKNLPELWQVRAQYIHNTYQEPTENYYRLVVPEYEKLLNLPSGTELYLWFEYDLFCQINMWFCLWLIHAKTFNAVYRVAPVIRNTEELWKGYSSMDTDDLVKCYNGRIKLTTEDIIMGAHLWEAYQKGDLEHLQKLAESTSACFPYLQEVCKAQVERVLKHRPEKVLQNITANGITDFPQIFQLFSLSEGIYGFGDSQVKEIYDTLQK